MRGIAASLLLVTLAAPAFAQEKGPRIFAGPMRYCGYKFATDLARGDKIEVELGPDFVVERLVSDRGGFGLYEGFAPQDGTGEYRVEAGLGKPTYRIGDAKRGYGYVVWTGTRAAPFYLHVWGQAFKGDPADFRLLKRMEFGEAAMKGCTRLSLR